MSDKDHGYGRFASCNLTAGELNALVKRCGGEGDVQAVLNEQKEVIVRDRVYETDEVVLDLGDCKAETFDIGVWFRGFCGSMQVSDSLIELFHDEIAGLFQRPVNYKSRVLTLARHCSDAMTLGDEDREIQWRLPNALLALDDVTSDHGDQFSSEQNVWFIVRDDFARPPYESWAIVVTLTDGGEYKVDAERADPVKWRPEGTKIHVQA
ncbi:hypothetical protein N9L26_00620 [Candidatus Pacebacteria bacterium]|nr:hypothetical protein [Candidatus Paceibacterota bacterium]